MKKQTVLVIGLALLFGLCLFNTATAAGPQGRAVFKHHRPSGDGELGLLSGCLRQNLMVQALSEITNMGVEAVHQQLTGGGMRAFLNEHKIDRNTLRTAMQSKTRAMLDDLTEDGYITPEQRREIKERRELRAQRRELMRRLIRKGIADGSISAEQAGMLMGRRP